MVYLMSGQFLPSKRVCELLLDVLGCELSEGTLYNTRQRCYEQLELVEASLTAGIQGAEVGHFDETGMRVGGVPNVAACRLESRVDLLLHPCQTGWGGNRGNGCAAEVCWHKCA